MAIYIKYTGIDGDVSTTGHEKWIEFASFAFGVGRSIPMLVGKQTGRETSAPSLSEVNLIKEMDVSSPYLFQESLKGVAKKVEVHMTKSGADKVETYLEYVLHDCLISGYSLSSGGDGKPTESISLAFTKIEMKYVVWGEDHTKTSQIPVSYDLGAATAG